MIKKTAKSVPEQMLKSEVESQSQFSEKSMVVIDGGYLLCTVIWPPIATYGQAYQSYVSYIHNHFGLDTVVVSDGYDSKNSTKVAQQQQRTPKVVSRDFLFDREMKTLTTQSSFLGSGANKSRVIEMICREFQHQGIKH